VAEKSVPVPKENPPAELYWQSAGRSVITESAAEESLWMVLVVVFHHGAFRR